jgi:hypothetical protein
MGIKRIGGRWYVVHHRVKGLIGRPIKYPRRGFRTYKEALKQHKAIMVRRYGKY